MLVAPCPCPSLQNTMCTHLQHCRVSRMPTAAEWQEETLGHCKLSRHAKCLTKLSSTLDLPLLWLPTTATCGSSRLKSVVTCTEVACV